MNFEARLLELVREARWLGRLGCPVPEAAALVLPQEPKFRDYYDRLTHLLLVSGHSDQTSLLLTEVSCFHVAHVADHSSESPA